MAEHLRKNIFITGASSGIGRSCAGRFYAAGHNLFLFARRGDRLAQIKAELENGQASPAGEDGAKPEVHTYVMDLTDREAVAGVTGQILSGGRLPHVLLNNAGLAAGLEPVQSGNIDNWERMIDTNVKGLLYVTRSLLPAMIEAGGSRHIINIGSIAGHTPYPGGNVYNATKFAVRALNQALNIDLYGTPIKVTSIDPGAVETEFSNVRFAANPEKVDTVYKGFTPLTPEDIADAVLYAFQTPEHVNIQQMVIMPTAQRNPYLTYRQE